MTAPVRYRLKPQLVEAMQFPRGVEGQLAVVDWVRANGGGVSLYDGNVEYIPDLESGGTTWQWSRAAVQTPQGRVAAEVGDYIIWDSQGNFRPVPAAEFEKDFELWLIAEGGE